MSDPTLKDDVSTLTEDVDRMIGSIKSLKLNGKPPGARRVCFVDGCNFLSKMGTAMDDTETPKDKGAIASVKNTQITGPNARAALCLVHELLKAGFEVMFVIKTYFMEQKPGKKLKDIGILIDFPDEKDDDFIILKHAQRLGGFIISNDKYKQEKYDQFEDARARTIPFFYTTTQKYEKKDLFSITGRFVSNLMIHLKVSTQQFLDIAYCPLSDPMFPAVNYMQSTLKPDIQQKRIEICEVIEDYHRLRLCKSWFHYVMKEHPNIEKEVKTEFFDITKQDLPNTFEKFYEMYESHLLGQIWKFSIKHPIY